MTENDRTIISNFEERLYKLIFEYKHYKEATEKMARELQEKENLIKELQMHCSSIENSYNNLKQAKILSLSENDIQKTKDRISGLVREIDHCIESLKK